MFSAAHAMLKRTVLFLLVMLALGVGSRADVIILEEIVAKVNGDVLTRSVSTR